MILVTGATGTVGREVVRTLSETGQTFTALVRSETARDRFEQAGIPVVVADYDEPAQLTAALTGVEQVFLVSPGGPRQVAQESAVIDAAYKVGVRRFVKQSAMGANDQSPCAFQRWNGTVERHLMQSGIDYTILRPTGFMQNFVNFEGAAIAATSTLRAPLGEARVSWVDTRDVAAVAAAVLAQEGHEGWIYDLSGPEALSHHDVAAKLLSATGREVRYEALSDAEWLRQMVAVGLPEPAARAMLSLYQAYRETGSGPVTGWVEILTGRSPQTFDAFAQEHSSAFRGAH